jgi:hypothetical protein
LGVTCPRAASSLPPACCWSLLLVGPPPPPAAPPRRAPPLLPAALSPAGCCSGCRRCCCCCCACCCSPLPRPGKAHTSDRPCCNTVSGLGVMHAFGPVLSPPKCWSAHGLHLFPLIRAPVPRAGVQESRLAAHGLSPFCVVVAVLLGRGVLDRVIALSSRELSRPPPAPPGCGPPNRAHDSSRVRPGCRTHAMPSTATHNGQQHYRQTQQGTESVGAQKTHLQERRSLSWADAAGEAGAPPCRAPAARDCCWQLQACAGPQQQAGGVGASRLLPCQNLCRLLLCHRRLCQAVRLLLQQGTLERGRTAQVAPAAAAVVVAAAC